MRTQFDLLRPDTGSILLEQQFQQKTNHNRRSCLCEFQTGQEAMASNYRGGSAWVPGVVLEHHGPHTYSVQLNSDTVWKRHIDQLRSFVTSSASSEQGASSEEQFVPPNAPMTNPIETPNSESPPSDNA